MRKQTSNDHMYTYDGPVVQFGKIITERWMGDTIASSEAQARSYLTYQYKRSRGKTANTHIMLPGVIKKGRHVSYG